MHIPAVLLPLAAIGGAVMLIRPAWHHRYRRAVLAIGFAGMLGAILVAHACESLEEQITAKEGFAAAAGWDDRAGHSGAKAVWCETNTPANCESGG